MAVAYTRQMFIQRIRKHLNNGYPNDAYATSDNEIMLYLDNAIASQIRLSTYENMKIDGVMAIAEAFLITFNLLTLNKDSASGYWYTTLPQPPLALALGYSINRVYFGATSNSISYDCFPIEAKRTSYRMFMPLPQGIRYWVENNTIWLTAWNNTSLRGLNLYVQMPVNRTSDITQPMPIPDDVMEAIFNDVTTTLTKRYQEPKDIINDDLPAGNTNLKS